METVWNGSVDARSPWCGYFHPEVVVAFDSELDGELEELLQKEFRSQAMPVQVRSVSWK